MFVIKLSIHRFQKINFNSIKNNQKMIKLFDLLFANYSQIESPTALICLEIEIDLNIPRD